MKRRVIEISRRLLPGSVKRSIVGYGMNIARSDFDRLAYKYAFAPNMEHALAAFARRGFAPQTIVDIGAFQGDWSAIVRRIWPGARLFMIEGNEAKRSVLTPVAGTLDADLRFALLGAKDGQEVTFHVMGSGSSVYEENSSFDRYVEPRKLSRLDTVLSDVEGVDLIKIDTQGFELEVLKGAERLLNTASAIVMEVSLIQINKGAPLIHDVLPFMKERGFVSYEIVGIHRRHLDGAMNQVDVLFLREDSRFLADKSFN